MRYVVRRGDTLRKIANRLGIGVTVLLGTNPALERRGYLIPGQVLTVPETATKYEVQPGDTLYFITQIFGLSLGDLQAANPSLEREEVLKPGDVLVIPNPRSEEIVRTNEEYTPEDVVRDAEALRDKYPCLKTHIIGRSVMGKPICALQLGSGEKEVFYSGAWHANEWITATVLMKFVEDTARAYARKEYLRGYDVMDLLHRFTIWIVPMVNPDGVELSLLGIDPSHPHYQEVLAINNGSHNFVGWTANVRGVDLNHQWPALWEEEAKTSPKAPAPRHYGGPYPLSEPEARAVYEFTKSRDFLGVLAYHSQGQVIFWGFQHLEPPGSEEIVRRMQVVSTYTPVHTADSFAGYKDWFIQQYRRPGYTVEVGVGVNPVPLEQFDLIYNQNQAILLEAPLLFECYG
ncbi:gamma-D-glutamyl-{L}-meso-diaminopimelate peptidase I Metallo peptidase. MEROPS family M14C [Aneurinibacillus thermoaerophilus]|uniref:Gamma-D-glutamyl-(L)-meso-diaminopimelate peptidase I Metallo peptidase. MEROPS family M14C n=1 Tax=Aneurinibacillus thermoaerophilus TaxID=143495 RepID=A0A1G8D0L4_ANETH|nr:M14 family metallopeptidase [Aneurinibacillus thermoaerophilus]SDH50993.1 gamma-D-glutamyl-{L}-meso-diaminopimelate peptidase I Metallo peptidase. MEROPS family M14C [Aneurinibacillus thermoaerophilus]